MLRPRLLTYAALASFGSCVAVLLFLTNFLWVVWTTRNAFIPVGGHWYDSIDWPSVLMACGGSVTVSVVLAFDGVLLLRIARRPRDRPQPHPFDGVSVLTGEVGMFMRRRWGFGMAARMPGSCLEDA